MQQAPEEGSLEAQEKAEEEAMLRGGMADFPNAVAHSITGVHKSSVVCVRLGRPACGVVAGRDVCRQRSVAARSRR